MKTKFAIVISAIFLVFPGMSQTLMENLTFPPPENPGQNAGQLFGGIGLQVAGAGILAGSSYLLVLSPEEEADIWIYGMTIGAGVFVMGSGLIIRSIKNMVIARKSIREMKKKGRQHEISLNLESTPYGAGIVCRF